MENKPATLEAIKAPLKEEMAAYEEFLREALHSESRYFDDILKYIFDNRGKGVRPTLVMLWAKLLSGGKAFGKRTLLSASLIELIHTASLVHDDVIDRADVRHGKSSVNERYGGRNAILTGDFILSRIFELGMESLEFDILTYVSHAIKWLCEGEVIQDEQTKTLGMTHDKYYDIIDKKTASLLAISCGVGALSVKAPAKEVDAAYEFGRNIGMAFQIKGDILDYATADQTGKRRCADLHERKITLPLIETLCELSEKEQEEVKEWIRRGDNEAIALICNKIEEHNGIEKAEKIMDEFIAKAKHSLEAYPDSPYRTSLYLMCDFLAQRTK
jgi:octaprenyl-diphosphate synthase